MGDVNAAYVVFRIFELHGGSRVSVPVASVESEEDARPVLARLHEDVAQLAQMKTEDGGTVQAALGKMGFTGVDHQLMGIKRQGRIEQAPNIKLSH